MQTRKSVLLVLFIILFAFNALGKEPSESILVAKSERTLSLLEQLDSESFRERKSAFSKLHKDGLSVLYRIKAEQLKDKRSSEHAQNLRNLESSIRRSYIYRPLSITGRYYGTLNQIMEEIGLEYNNPLPLLDEDIKVPKTYDFRNIPFWEAVIEVLDDTDVGIIYDKQYQLKLVHGKISQGDRYINGPYLFVRLQDENQNQSRLIFLPNQRQYPLPELSNKFRINVDAAYVIDILGRGKSHNITHDLSMELLDINGLVVGYLVSLKIPNDNVTLQMRSNYRIRETPHHKIPKTIVTDPFWFEIEFGSR